MSPLGEPLSSRRLLLRTALRRLAWSLGGLLGAGVLLIAPRPSSALDVVACLALAGETLSITSDPRLCPSDRVLDAVAGSSRWVPGPGADSATFELTKRLDHTSPRLFLLTMTQKAFPVVLIAFFDSAAGGDGQRLYSIRLANVTISALANSADDTATRGALPLEKVTFQFTRSGSATT